MHVWIKYVGMLVYAVNATRNSCLGMTPKWLCVAVAKRWRGGVQGRGSSATQTPESDKHFD